MVDKERDVLSEGPLRALAEAAWQLVLLLGLASLVLGVLVLAWPARTLHVVGVLFGVYLLISGLLQLAAAFGTHVATSLRVMAFISGTLSILLGLICFRGPADSLLLLAFWIGIGWLFRGVTLLAAALSDPLMPARGWNIFAAVISMLGGIAVMSSPFSSLAVLAVFAGIWLLVMGVMEIFTALRVWHAMKQLPAGVQ